MTAFAPKLRGLVGTAITWGAIGGALGAVAFLVPYRLWPLNAIPWLRTILLFGRWESAAVVWGVGCGFAFGLALLVGERTRHFHRLSARRLTIWGAVAGAAFPALLGIPRIIAGSPGALPLFSMIIVASSLAGAAWARASFAMARRLPTAIRGDEASSIGTLAKGSSSPVE